MVNATLNACPGILCVRLCATVCDVRVYERFRAHCAYMSGDEHVFDVEVVTYELGIFFSHMMTVHGLRDIVANI